MDRKHPVTKRILDLQIEEEKQVFDEPLVEDAQIVEIQEPGPTKGQVIGEMIVVSAEALVDIGKVVVPALAYGTGVVLSGVFVAVCFIVRHLFGVLSHSIAGGVGYIVSQTLAEEDRSNALIKPTVNVTTNVEATGGANVSVNTTVNVK